MLIVTEIIIYLFCRYCAPGSEFPVFGFGQLEPCDDPRHTVYVWVTCQSPSQSLPLASLYSISYGSKQYLKNYGTFYEVGYLYRCQ